MKWEFREDSSYEIRRTRRFFEGKTKEIKRTVPIGSSLATIRLRRISLSIRRQKVDRSWTDAGQFSGACMLDVGLLLEEIR